MGIKKPSIITNFFQCFFECPYCVWRNSGNFDKYKNFIWTKERLNFEFEERLKSLLKENLQGNIYSVSGGTDPLSNFDSFASRRFYEILDNINQELGTKYQLHTARIDLLDSLPVRVIVNLDKIALHIFENSDIGRVIKLSEYLQKQKIKLRLALVVTSFLKKSYCESIERAFENSEVQISYRELWPVCQHRELDWFKNANQRNSRYRFVEQKDYNIYIMPDLSVTNKFIQE